MRVWRVLMLVAVLAGMLAEAGRADGLESTGGNVFDVQGNIAPNPSFEAGNSGPTGWERPNSHRIWSTDWARSGGRSACFTNLPADSSHDWYSGPIPVEPGTVYRFGGFVHGDFQYLPNRYLYMMVAFGDSSGSHSPEVQSIEFKYEAGRWSFESNIFEVPSWADSVKLGIGFNNPGPAWTAGHVCFDDVILGRNDELFPSPEWFEWDELGLVSYVDRYRAHSLGTDVWEVWVCEAPGGTASIDLSGLVVDLNSDVGPYFDWLSGGTYRSIFQPGGVVAIDAVTWDACKDAVSAVSSGGVNAAFIMNNYGGCCSHGEEGNFVADTFPENQRVVNVNPDTTLPIWVHEIGHTLYWGHPGSDFQSPYDNPMDMMSGTLGVGTNATHRTAAGWIGADRIAVYTGGVATFEIGALGAEADQLLVVHSGRQGIYTAIGVRTRESYDSALAMEGVEAYSVDMLSQIIGGYQDPPSPYGYDNVHDVGDSFVAGTVMVSVESRAGSVFTLRVTDTTPPMMDVPRNMTAEATGPGGAVLAFMATARDAAPPNPPVTCLPGSGLTFPLGVTTVTCSAVDASGNTGTSTFTITVRDSTAPTLSLSSDVTVEAIGPSGTAVNFAATATDLVAPLSPTVTCVPASGATFPLGTTTVSCSATDTAGNTGISRFTVTVRDTTGPTVSVHAPVVVEATGPAGALVTYADPTASDLVAPLSPPVSCAPASGSTFRLGATTVTCSATDGAGNLGTSTFTVTVGDTTGPEVTAPASMTVDTHSVSGMMVTYSAATVTDAVGVTSGPFCVPASGSLFPVGLTTVTCTASDAAGNVGTGSFTVTVNLVPLVASFRSVGSYDGWVLEKDETSGKGGTFDAAAATGRVGDDALNRQYRSVLHFDTSSLPDDAVIAGVTVRVKRQSIVGTNPFTTHGFLRVDMRTGAFHSNPVLEILDFQAAGRANVGRFSKTASGGWYRAPLRAVSYPLVNLTGTTQFRLRFGTDDNDNGVPDYLSFYTGNTSTVANRPELIVTYYVP